MHFATDEKSLVTDEDVTTTVYRITLNHSMDIGLLSFISPIPTKILIHHDQNGRHVTSKASKTDEFSACFIFSATVRQINAIQEL